MRADYCEHCGQLIESPGMIRNIDVLISQGDYPHERNTAVATRLCDRCHEVAISRIKGILSNIALVLPKYAELETATPPSQTKAAASETQDAA